MMKKLTLGLLFLGVSIGVVHGSQLEDATSNGRANGTSFGKNSDDTEKLLSAGLESMILFGPGAVGAYVAYRNPEYFADLFNSSAKRGLMHGFSMFGSAVAALILLKSVKKSTDTQEDAAVIMGGAAAYAAMVNNTAAQSLKVGTAFFAGTVLFFGVRGAVKKRNNS